MIDVAFAAPAGFFSRWRGFFVDNCCELRNYPPHRTTGTPEREGMMGKLGGITIYTHPKGEWRVAVLLSDGRTAITDPARYASEASAVLSAKRQHHDKPFMNLVAVRESGAHA